MLVNVFAEMAYGYVLLGRADSLPIDLHRPWPRSHSLSMYFRSSIQLSRLGGVQSELDEAEQMRLLM